MRISKKPEERKKEIMDTAITLFAAQGYENTTVEDITKAMNIAKGSFYNYFKSKQEVFEAFIELKSQSIVCAYLEILACENKTPSERIRDYIEYNFKLSQEGNNKGLSENLNSPVFELVHYRAHREGIHKILPVFVDLFDEGKRNCNFKVEDSEFSASALLGALQGVHNLLSSRKDESPDHHRRLVYDLIDQMLGVDIR